MAEKEVRDRRIELPNGLTSVAEDESKDRYYWSLMGGIREDIVVLDRSRRIIDFNGARSVITGHERDEIVGRFCFEILHGNQKPCDELGQECPVLDVLRTGLPRSFRHVYRRKDGSKVQVDSLFSPVKNEDGEVKHIILASRDIADLVEAQEALRESETRYRSLIDNSPDGIAVHCDGRIVFANGAMAELLGGSVEDLIGRPILDIVRADSREGVQLRAEQVLENGEALTRLDRVFIRLDGTEVDVDVTVLPFNYGGRPAVQMVVRDLTQQRRLEKQLRQAQKMEAIGQLAGGIAHDFNNILQAIMGNVAFAKAGLAPETDRYKDIEAIGQSAEKAARLTRQLLAFSRRQIIEPVYLDLSKVILEMLKMLRRLIGEHIELAHVPGENLGSVYADPAQFEQVLVNLCLNARDAMPDGGKITVETRNVIINEAYAEMYPWAKAGHYVLLSVSDTGSGMDEETREHMFEPFFTTKEEGRGTGLGMATTYGIIKQHNGMIHVYSEVGKGTTVKTYLPLVEQDPSTVDSKPAAFVRGGTEGILLAEDDKPVRDLTVRILEKAGYKVFTAVDGLEAIRVHNAHADEISLVLLDVVMPTLNGREVFERITETKPDIGVLFTSGYSANAIHTKFVFDEGLELIQKPYGADSLLSKVREVLDEQE